MSLKCLASIGKGQMCLKYFRISVFSKQGKNTQCQPSAQSHASKKFHRLSPVGCVTARRHGRAEGYHVARARQSGGLEGSGTQLQKADLRPPSFFIEEPFNLWTLLSQKVLESRLKEVQNAWDQRLESIFHYPERQNLRKPIPAPKTQGAKRRLLKQYSIGLNHRSNQSFKTKAKSIVPTFGTLHGFITKRLKWKANHPVALRLAGSCGHKNKVEPIPVALRPAVFSPTQKFLRFEAPPPPLPPLPHSPLAPPAASGRRPTQWPPGTPSARRCRSLPPRSPAPPKRRRRRSHAPRAPTPDAPCTRGGDPKKNREFQAPPQKKKRKKRTSSKQVRRICVFSGPPNGEGHLFFLPGGLCCGAVPSISIPSCLRLTACFVSPRVGTHRRVGWVKHRYTKRKTLANGNKDKHLRSPGGSIWLSMLFCVLGSDTDI